MHPDTQTPLASAIGVALGQVHWALAVDPDSAEILDHATGSGDTGARGLPLTDIDLHVTGHRGSLPDVLRGLLALLHRIAAGGRARPTPVEQDYVTGYLRHLLRASTSGADQELLRAAMTRPDLDSPAVRAALDSAWLAVS